MQSSFVHPTSDPSRYYRGFQAVPNFNPVAFTQVRSNVPDWVYLPAASSPRSSVTGSISAPRTPDATTSPCASTPESATEGNKPHVPRPPNAFILFRSQFWKEEKAKRKPNEHQINLSKDASKLWNSMTEEERIPFREKAEELKREVMANHPGHKFTPKRRKRNSNSTSANRREKKPYSKPEKAPKKPKFEKDASKPLEVTPPSTIYPPVPGPSLDLQLPAPLPEGLLPSNMMAEFLWSQHNIVVPLSHPYQAHVQQFSTVAHSEPPALPFPLTAIPDHINAMSEPEGPIFNAYQPQDANFDFDIFGSLYNPNDPLSDLFGPQPMSDFDLAFQQCIDPAYLQL